MTRRGVVEVSSRVPVASQPFVDDHGEPSRAAGRAGSASGQTARQRLVVGAGAVALVLSGALVVVGGSPALLLVVAVAATTLVLRCWLPTPLALATVLSAAFALVAVVMRLLPVVGVPVTSVLVLPALATVVALALLWVRPRTAFRASGAALALGTGLAALCLLQVVAVPLVRWLTDETKLAWMMRNDSTWNLISSRFVLEDGGLDPSAHRNPAPLANELVAIYLAPGRSAVDRTHLLAHDLYRVSEALLLLVGATSLLAGLMVASAIPASRPWSRAVLAVTAAAIPWGWSFSGVVFTYGFWNSVPAAILLLAAWAAWTSSESLPAVSSGVLALVGTALLASWAPLVLMPAVLGIVVVVWRWRAHLALRGVALVGWLAPLVVLVLYLALVTLDDRSAASGGLSADGGFPPFGEHLPPMVWMVSLAVVLLLSAWSSTRIDLVGVLAVGFAGAVGLLYLMDQRLGSPAGPWGYYPQKFAWTLSLLAPVVVLMSVRVALADEALRRVQRGSLVIAAMMIAGVLLLQVPPDDPRPVTSVEYPIAHRTPDYRLSSVLLVASIALPDRSSALDPAADALLELEDPASKVVASRWFADPGYNAFVNFWLLQLPVDRADELPRPYAYGLDSFDPLALCALVRDWGGGVELYTHSDTLEREMRDLCPRLEFDVILR